MRQYLIYLKNESEESCCLVTSNLENAIERLSVFRDVAKRDCSWFELREYINTKEYRVLNV